MFKGGFIQNLPKIYGRYTGGFIVFILLMAIAEQAGMDPDVRERTDALDSLGNTTAATGKGFAIGSAVLTALALMAAYSYYAQDYYDDAIAELERFIKVYPSHKDINYAYYLMAICYYEQIVDEKKDLQSIIKAKRNFEIISRN